jgi:hypothetical protein
MINNQANDVPMQPNIDISQSISIICKNCGHDRFTPIVKVRKISKLLFGGSEDMIIPFNILLCSNCGLEEEDTKPQELKSLEDKDKIEINK